MNIRSVGRGVRSARCEVRGAKPRRGSVLVVVLVIVAVLSLGAYTFSEFMIVEAQATSMYARDAQARAAADSGIELAASLLVRRNEQNPEDFFHNPEWFQGVLLRDAPSEKGRSRFSLVAPVENDPAGASIRFGLIDESCKLNLNTLLSLGLEGDQLRQRLMFLPEMTADIADAILDFIDSDQTVREMGAEDETYSALGYSAKNGPLDSLDELLMVRGVTPWLLFGEDANRNGVLDPSENDGDTTPPTDDGDGLLNRGWSAFLTIHSREINIRADGQDRINVNQNSLGELYDQLVPEFDEDAAKFVIAYRMAGPRQQAGSPGSNQQGNTMAGGGGSRGGGGGSAGSLGSVGSSGQTTTAQEVGRGVRNDAQITTATNVQQGQGVTNVQQNQGVRNVAGAVSSAITAAGSGSVTRGGIDVTSGGQFQVNSLYDLIDVEVQININGTNTTLKSPWSSSTSDMKGYLPKLMDVLSTSANRYIEGRLNISQARRELIMGLPQITDTIADAIVGGQPTTASGEALSGQSSDRATSGWLVIQGVVDLPTMRQLDRYITARGDVFRLQSVGYFDRGGPSARIEAVIDATQDPPQVVFLRDLTDLGRGYSTNLLTTGVGPAQ